MSKQQIHKRLSREQVIAIFENYFNKEIRAKAAMENLGLKKSQFFNLAANYEEDPDNFDVKFKRDYANRRIPEKAEDKILKELKAEKKLIDNKDIAIRTYNYSAVRDLLEEKHSIVVSLPTIINRAKERGYYMGKPPKKIHDREVLTNLAGEMLQHDSSHHLWSPYMDKKLYLITTIDDYSRMILYAELVEEENVWAHILALKSVFLRYGCPLKYYADQHSIFRYVKDRDRHRPFNVYTKFTDDVITQWKRVILECKVNAIYALSPQAKGKVERPYGWIQDRLVRTAAKENIDTVEGLRKILKELIYKYNHRWVHSTTKEIPINRFEDAIRSSKSIFKPFKLPKGKTIDDIFCLKVQRVVDAYRKISLDGNEIKVPNGIPRQTIDLKIAPDVKKGLVKIRFWQKDIFLGEALLKKEELPSIRF